MHANTSKSHANFSDAHHDKNRGARQERICHARSPECRARSAERHSCVDESSSGEYASDGIGAVVASRLCEIHQTLAERELDSGNASARRWGQSPTKHSEGSLRT